MVANARGRPWAARLSVNAESNPVFQAQMAAFRGEFRKLGWVDARNILIDYRWGRSDGSRVRPLRRS